jgi:hypothetical protein
MSSNTPNDPMSMFRQMVTQWETMANELGSKISSTSEFAQGMQGITAASMQIQSVTGEAMAKVLAAANLPSRADLLALGDRIGAVEGQLHQIEALLSGGAQVSGAAAPKPKRTKTPPPKAA